MKSSPSTIAFVALLGLLASDGAVGDERRSLRRNGDGNNMFDDPHDRRERIHPWGGSQSAAMGDSGGGSSEEDDANANAAGGVCRSIIAIGNTRLPSRRDRNLGGESPRLQPPSWRDEYNDGYVDGESGGYVSGAEGEEEVEVAEDGEEFVCELADGSTVPVRATEDQLGELRRALNDGRLVSAVTTVSVVENGEEEEEEDIYHAGGGGDLFGEDEPSLIIAGMKPDPSFVTAAPPAPKKKKINSVTLPSGSVRFSHHSGRLLRHQQASDPSDSDGTTGRRHLARYSGTKSALVVKVTDSLGRAVSATPRQISDKFFGTFGDAENMRSQFASCSLGGLQLVPDTYGSINSRITRQLSAPGVLEVTIGTSLNNPQHVIRDAIKTQVEGKLGIRLPHPAVSHVLYVLKECFVDCGWAAYAYVNSWLSVYQGGYFAFPAVQMHEVGHNLNLAHSGGLDGAAYTDHTCLMGNPLFHDHVGDMCFNPAKTHQIVMSGEFRPSSGNWYGSDRVETFDATRGTKFWSGKLIGVAELGSANVGANQGRHANDRVVLKIEMGSRADLYVGYNRAVGFNSDTQQAPNRVTVVEAGGEGLTYSQSYLRAVLGTGQSYSVRYWRGGPEDLTVTLERVDVASGEPWVAVVSVVVGDGLDPTPPPTRPPTKQPTKQPTRLPTKNPTNNPTPPPSNSPTPEPTTFPTNNPTPMPSSSPTSEPTNYPTPPPTESPTTEPTKSPNKNPTAAPTTYQPTSASTTTGGDSGVIEFPNPDDLFTPNRVSNGTMFTIEAAEDVTILSLSTYTSDVDYGLMQVYVRQGSYVGHSRSNDNWNLVYNRYVAQRGMYTLTRLDFPDDQVVDIEAGSTVSFYVYTTKKLAYHYSDELIEGSEIGNDGSLKLFVGMALAYGKWEEGCGAASPRPDGQCIFSPRAFSGSLEYSVVQGTVSTSTTSTTTSETTTTTVSTTLTTSDSGSINSLSTPNRKGANTEGGNGLVFTVSAKQDIVMTGMNILAARRTASEVDIYTRRGDLTDESVINAADGWTSIYEGSIPYQNNKLVELDDFNQGVRIAAGETQAFFVYSENGLIYDDGEGFGIPYADDASAIIYEGKVTTGLFERPLDDNAKWAGIIRYYNE